MELKEKPNNKYREEIWSQLETVLWLLTNLLSRIEKDEISYCDLNRVINLMIRELGGIIHMRNP